LEQLWLTALLNRLFAGPANALLNALHLPSHHPRAPITNDFAMELLVTIVLFFLFFLVRARLSVEQPGALQHLFEGLYGFIDNQGHEIIGHHHEPYTPFVAAIFIYVLFCNLLGLIPGFESPTASPWVPLGLAVCTFCYYNFMGIKKQGPLGYAKHFMGPIWWMAWLMIPIELISNVARVMSLTIRLYANMFAGDMVTLAFFSLVPLGIPVVFLGLHVGVSFLQAYIFALLTTVYLQGAVAEEH
jgi:F-type H+-transporting ATPase subunit a